MTASQIAALARDGYTDAEIQEFALETSSYRLEDDDSEWADRQRGFGQSDDLVRNDAGEWLGFM